MKSKTLVLITTLSVLILGGTTVMAKGQPVPKPGAQVVPDAIWADDYIYGTAATPTEFNDPQEHTLDYIYSFMNSGLEGQRSISETKPGDKDYNGGRWAVFPVTYTALGLAHFDNGDGKVNYEITSDWELAWYATMGYVSIANEPVLYFVCPLRGPGKHVE